MSSGGKVAKLISSGKLKGSAWLISPTHAVTAAHCVRTEDDRIFPDLTLEFHGLETPIRVEIRDRDTDLLLDWDVAILTVLNPAYDLEKLVIPLSRQPCQRGDRCYPHGHPSHDSHRNPLGFSFRAEVINPAHGYILRKNKAVEVIQFGDTTAWKNLHGISGAPIFNDSTGHKNDAAIGIISEHRDEDEFNIYGIAILKIAESSSIVRKVLDSSPSDENLGYEHWREDQNNWLDRQLKSEKESWAKFLQNMAVLDPSIKVIRREEANRKLDSWWIGWPDNSQSFFLLGEEGDGKTWAAISWIAEKIQSKTFPPVVVVPAFRVSADDPESLILDAIRSQLKGPNRDNYWQIYFERWLELPVNKNPLVLLFIDGINERPSHGWRAILDQFAVEPFENRIAIVATCRTDYWKEHIGNHPNLSADSWILSPYNESELQIALSKSGVPRDKITEDILELVSKPRYFALMVKLMDQMRGSGDVTLERLIYEDWRDRISRKTSHKDILSHEDFQELISNLAWKMKEKSIPRKEVYSELESFGDGKDLIEEFLSGKILHRDNGQLTVDRKYLILGLGLYLANEVRKVVKSGEKEVSETIGKYIGMLDIDLNVSILGMAVCHVMELGEYPEECRLALFQAWISGRNFELGDLNKITAYFPSRPRTYFSMAERVWSDSVDNREIQEAFMARFLEYGEKPQIQNLMIEVFERWFGFIFHEGIRGFLAHKDEDREKGKQKLSETLGGPVNVGSTEFHGFRFEIVSDKGLLRLARVALAVISHQKRGLFVKPIITGVVSQTVTGGILYQELLNWVIRTATDDIENVFLDEARKLFSIDNDVFKRAAWELLTPLATTEARSLQNKMDNEYEYKVYGWSENDPCKSGNNWIKANYIECLDRTISHLNPTKLAGKLADVALEPEIAIQDNVCEILLEAGQDIDLSNMKISRPINYKSSEDLAFERIETALCAFCPSHYVELVRSLALLLPERNFESSRDDRLAKFVYEHMIIFNENERKAIDAAWRKILHSDLDGNVYNELILFPCTIQGRDPKQQFELVLERKHKNKNLTYYPSIFKPANESIFPLLTRRLIGIESYNSYNDNEICNILWYLSRSLETLDDSIRAELFRFFVNGDAYIKHLCLKIFHRTKDNKAIEWFLYRDWRVENDQYPPYGNWGWRILSEYGTDLPLDEIRERVSPEFIGYAIEKRGLKTEEIAAFSDLLMDIWRKATEIKCENNICEASHVIIATSIDSDEHEPDSYIFEDNYGQAKQIFSWWAVWGGISSGDRHKMDDFERSQNIQSIEYADKKLMAAHECLHQLIKSQREKGNPWFAQSFGTHALAEVIQYKPDYVEKWIAQILSDDDDSDYILMKCRGFYEALCEVLLELGYDKGVDLFKRLYSFKHYRFIGRLTGTPRSLFYLFKAKETKRLINLRNEILNQCVTDYALNEFCFAAQFKGSGEWLFETATSYLKADVPFHRAFGLRILGFMDDSRTGKRLMEWEQNTPNSWVKNIAKLALDTYTKNQWARQWFEIFMQHQGVVRALGAFRVFLRCVDRRFWLWNRPMRREKGFFDQSRQEHFRANRESIKKAIEKNEKESKLNDTFIGHKVLRNQAWPWMKK